MKSKSKLKEQLHTLIDGIDDEYVLTVLNEDIMPYVINNRTKKLDEEEELTPEQEKELEEAIREADRGETITYDEFKEQMNRWRTKLKSTRLSK